MKQTIHLKESELKKMITESVRKALKESSFDDEMAVWRERENSPFFKILRKIEKYVIDLFGTENDEYGISTSPIGYDITEFALDGNMPYTAKKIYRKLENYDMLHNGNRSLDILVNKMMKLANA